MKIYKTIEAYKQAWMILREMNLEWIFSGVKPETMELPLTKIIDGLLVDGKLCELMKAVTQSEYYVAEVDADGRKWTMWTRICQALRTRKGYGYKGDQRTHKGYGYQRKTPWEKTDIELVTRVATDFFVGMLPMFSVLGMLGNITAAGKENNANPDAVSS